ncbi:MAG: alpha/beta hydrolase [Hyphomonadaceae bacterium]|jgi:pimeloyl-ACP methyl ester carboxylesterase|nr:alpha/beta hydrolase [Hyphomonadaceae bacterium]
MELKVDGRRVYAATGGRPFESTRPAVIFIHGAGQDHSNWQLPARWFAWHDHAVLAIDLPGHGRSDGPPQEAITDMAQWIGRLMDAAGIKRAGLVGHSMGGAIAIEAAAAFPDRISRMALLGTALAMPVNDVLLTAAREAPETAHRMITAWALGPRAKVGGNPAPGLWMSGGSMALLGRNRPGVLYTAFAACNRWQSGPDAARRVRCPALVIMGSSDSMTPPKIGRTLAEAIPGSRTVTIPNSGHMMMAEAPDAVLDALIDFFAMAGAA